MADNNNNYPNLLIISINAWSDRNSTGNTLSNHFGEWPSENIANVFLRNEEIENSVCHKYFRIYEKDIFSSFFRGKSSKEIYSNPGLNDNLSNETKSEYIYDRIKKIRPYTILLLRELFWWIGFRKLSGLDEFLLDFNPQVIHIHCPHLIYPHRVLYHCQKVTRAKVVLYCVDENYTYKSKNPFGALYQLMLRKHILKTIKHADKNYGITPELCEYYTEISNKNFELLYKGADVTKPSERSVTFPLQIIYAGNLQYDRWKTLALLVNAIKQINDQKVMFYLSIYTTTPLTKEMRKSLNCEFSAIKGSLSFREIEQKLKSSDIVIHAEAFDDNYSKITKYSFSTKIVDCIQSGSCIFGIGPDDLASISFLKKSEGALLATTPEQILKTLNQVAADKEIINEKRNKMYYFAKDAFNKRDIRQKLYSSIRSL